MEAELRRASKLGTMGITTEGLAAPPASPRTRLSFLPPRDLGVWGLRVGLARLAGFLAPAPGSSPATPGPPRVERTPRARELRYDRTVVVEAEVGRVMQVLNDLPRYQDWAGKGVLKEVKMLNGGLPTPASEREVEYKVRLARCGRRPASRACCSTPVRGSIPPLASRLSQPCLTGMCTTPVPPPLPRPCLSACLRRPRLVCLRPARWG